MRKLSARPRRLPCASRSKGLLGNVARTSRGFEIVSFLDHYGQECSLQQSSLAHYPQPGTSAVWLGANENAKPHPITGEELSNRMHLTRSQVQALVGALQRWLDTGSFGPPKTCVPCRMKRRPTLPEAAARRKRMRKAHKT